jgi:hypothetical protein
MIKSYLSSFRIVLRRKKDTKDFLTLQVRCSLSKTGDQQVARYINGRWALKAERLMMRRIASKTPYPHTELP